MKEIYVDGTDVNPKLAELASRCKFGHSWRQRFSCRFRVVPRRRTNKKILPLVQRMVKWKLYHRGLRRFVCRQKDDTAKAAEHGFIPVVVIVPLRMTVAAVREGNGLCGRIRS